MPNDTHLWLKSDVRVVKVKCECVATDSIGAMFINGFGTEADKRAFNNRQDCHHCHGTGFVEKRVEVRIEVIENRDAIQTHYECLGMIGTTVGRFSDKVIDSILSRYTNGDESVKQFVEEVEDDGE